MLNLIIVNNVKDWPLTLPNAEVVDARSYLTDPRFGEMRGARVFNLCRSYKYQNNGYYVSLLATARGHKPLPGITTIQDMKSSTMVRYASEEMEGLIQKSLAPIHSDKFVLSVYFGKNLARRYDKLGQEFFHLFQAPFLRAEFTREPGSWTLSAVRPIGANEISDEHWAFVHEAVLEYFEKGPSRGSRKEVPRYYVAMLVNPEEQSRPSNDRAIQKFIRAGEKLGVEVEIIGKDDYSRLAEFDALFIRETTSINHHTYRFARRAVAEGLVVIDEPEAILKCMNKVYLAELLNRHKIPHPKTLIIHKDNKDTIEPQLGLPCILKQPDSAFSQGVVKAETAEELAAMVEKLLDKSDLIIAQEFIPTQFDWRVGVLDRKPIFVCKYHMARKHWQIIRRDDDGEKHYGNVETIPVDQAPKHIVSTAVKAAGLIGDGLFGVDMKQVDNKAYVIEVNENPNIDCGFEDQLLKDELYSIIMQWFVDRLDRRREARAEK